MKASTATMGISPTPRAAKCDFREVTARTSVDFLMSDDFFEITGKPLSSEMDSDGLMVAELLFQFNVILEDTTAVMTDGGPSTPKPINDDEEWAIFKVMAWFLPKDKIDTMWAYYNRKVTDRDAENRLIVL